MKKYSILLVVISLFVVSNKTNAQKTLQFFDEIGVEKLQTAEMDAMADTIAVVNHRWDDIAWSRTVYRVIDMRDKQNFQLYFPTRPNDQYRSLFRVMLDAVANGIMCTNVIHVTSSQAGRMCSPVTNCHAYLLTTNRLKITSCRLTQLPNNGRWEWISTPAIFAINSNSSFRKRYFSISILPGCILKLWL